MDFRELILDIRSSGVFNGMKQKPHDARVWPQACQIKEG